ncbi:MAG: phosphoribosylglycinamide formyltransferase [candidate division Zixibacteria bacterium]|nr:phosphoribosylglycinamide formyltransferase [candidate division Zixibacteria bacterium]
MRLRLAILASGSGTNLQAVLDQIAEGKLAADVAVVISNNSDSQALERARKVGIEAVHWSEKKAGSPAQFSSGLLEMLQHHRIDLVVLAGYMKLVPIEVVRAFHGRIINIHPALLPKYGGPGFYGMRVHEAVIAAGEKQSGATVHFVDAEYDHGSVLMQREVPVLPNDTPATLRDRILAVEHELLPAAIAEFAAKYWQRPKSQEMHP